MEIGDLASKVKVTVKQSLFFLHNSLLTSFLCFSTLFCSIKMKFTEPPSVECQDIFNSSQINACVVGMGVLGPRFIVSSEALGLNKMLPARGFEFDTSRMPHKRPTTRVQLSCFYNVYKKRTAMEKIDTVSMVNASLISRFYLHFSYTMFYITSINKGLPCKKTRFNAKA